MGSKNYYSSAEYFKLFDDMNQKVQDAKNEKSKIESELNNTIERLELELDAEKNKTKILQKRLLQATDDFLKLMRPMDDL